MQGVTNHELTSARTMQIWRMMRRQKEEMQSRKERERRRAQGNSAIGGVSRPRHDGWACILAILAPSFLHNCPTESLYWSGTRRRVERDGWRALQQMGSRAHRPITRRGECFTAKLLHRVKRSMRDVGAAVRERAGRSRNAHSRAWCLPDGRCRRVRQGRRR